MTLTSHDTDFGDSLRAMAPALAHSGQVRTVFNSFPAAVGALCAKIDGQPQGLVATSLSIGTSFDPPMTLFSVRKESSTWPSLRAAPRLGISVLGEGQGELCRQISSRSGDRFANVHTTVTEHGAVFVEGAATWLDCEIAHEMPAGDHTVVIFEIHSVGHNRATPPLVFHNGSFPRLERNTGAQ